MPYITGVIRILHPTPHHRPNPEGILPLAFQKSAVPHCSIDVIHGRDHATQVTVFLEFSNQPLCAIDCLAKSVSDIAGNMLAEATESKAVILWLKGCANGSKTNISDVFQMYFRCISDVIDSQKKIYLKESIATRNVDCCG